MQGRRLKVSHVVGLSSAAADPSALPKRSQEVNNADSCNGHPPPEAVSPQKGANEHPLLLQPPTEWFGPLADELLALQPQKLGQVIPVVVKMQDQLLELIFTHNVCWLAHLRRLYTSSVA